MYFYENGKKVQHNKENFQPFVRENLDSDNGCGKCPTWVFIILGSIALIVTIWLIYCIIRVMKKNRV
jgi:hypothetical protein